MKASPTFVTATCFLLMAMPGPTAAAEAPDATPASPPGSAADGATPVVPLTADAPPDPSAPASRPPTASGTASPPAPRWPAPSLLDPAPGMPGGPPLPSPPPVTTPGPRGTSQGLALGASVARRSGGAPTDVPPRYGWGVGAAFFRRLAALAPGLSLRGRLDLSHHRFAGSDTAVQQTDLGPVEVSDVRLVSQTSFLLGPELTLDTPSWRVSLGASFGLSIGYFHSIAATYGPGDLTAHQGVARASFGLLYRWNGSWAFGARVAWWGEVWPAPPRLEPDTTGRKRDVFGDWADLGLAVEYGF